MIRRVLALAGLLAALAVSPHALGGTAEDRKLGIEITWNEDWSGALGVYEPIQLTILDKKKKHTLRITVSEESFLGYGSGLGSSKGVSVIDLALPLGETKIELPVLRADASYYSVKVDVDGRRNTNLSFTGGSGPVDATVPTILVIGRGFESGESSLASVIEASDDLDVLHTEELSPDSASRYWQSYLGIPAVVALRTEDAVRLAPDERLALSRWVRFGGGTLWLHGDDREGALESMRLFAGSVRRTGELVEVGCMTGTVLLTRGLEDLADSWFAEVQESISVSGGVITGPSSHIPEYEQIKTVAYDSMARAALFDGKARWMLVNEYSYTTSYYKHSPYVSGVKSCLDDLLDGLHDVPRVGYVLISFLLAFLIGPLNLIVLRLKRRLALFYVTAPLIAGVGMAALLAYTILDEGLILKRKTASVMLHDPASGQGVVYQAHGTFGGLTTRKRPVYPVETAVVPFHTDDQGSGTMSLVTDWTEAQRLSSGWIASRKQRGLLTATPTKVRMSMKLTRGADGSVHVENGLTSMAKVVAARVDPCVGKDPCVAELQYYIARDVKAGESARMEPSEEIVDVPLIYLDQMDWTIAAQMEGLPHLEDKGLGGEVLRERFYYVAVPHLEQADVALVEEAPAQGEADDVPE
ncbi:MAG: hypothetical protein JRG91_01710 [Deltaproteobacteria bacterium]|nr:hypothetical protein [Deltaproteobacteria bacterium]